ADVISGPAITADLRIEVADNTDQNLFRQELRWMGFAESARRWRVEPGARPPSQEWNWQQRSSTETSTPEHRSIGASLSDEVPLGLEEGVIMTMSRRNEANRHRHRDYRPGPAELPAAI